MATYKDTALASSNLVALWMLNDATNATVAVDSGPNNLPLTYTSAKVDGVENILSGGLGMLSGGTNFYAQRTVASGTPLASSTSAYTITAWLTPTSTTANSVLAGRTNHFRMQYNAAGFGSIGWDAAGAFDTRTGVYAQANSTYFVATVFNGSVYRIYVNGVLLQENVRIGTLPTTTDNFFIGTSSTPFPGTISGVGVWSRAISGAEIKELWLAGTKVTEAADGLVDDLLYDSTKTIIANAALGSRCVVCQGLRRVNEPVISKSGNFFHPACYAAKGAGKILSVPSSSSVITDYEGPVLRLLHLVMHSLAKRITAWPRPTYYDGARLQLVTDARTGGMDVFMPWMCTTAVIAHHLNFPRQHWMIDLIIQQMEFVWSLQQSDGKLYQPSDVGTNIGVGSDFVTGPLGEAILYLKPYVTATVWNRWVTNFLAVGDALYDTKPDANGNATVVPESNFYVNGNREAGELWGLYMMYLVSGKSSKWLNRYNDQYTYLTTYEQKLHAGLNNYYYGFVTVVAPTQADGSDGKGYLIERTSGKVSHIVSLDGTTTYDGYDPNYVSLCTQFLMRLYLHSNDPRILKIINMQINMSLDKVNTVTGSVVSTTLAAPVAIGDKSFTTNTLPAYTSGGFNIGTGTGAELVIVASITGTSAPYTATLQNDKAFTKVHSTSETATRDAASWILDGRGGSRQDNTASFGSPQMFFAGMYQNSSRVTPAMVAGSFAEMIRFEQNDTLNASFVNRDVNSIGTWLMSLPSWPGDDSFLAH